MANLDFIIYFLVAIVAGSLFLEGKRTRYKTAIFFFSVGIYLSIIMIGFANWFFYDSKFGFGIAALALFAMLSEKLRILTYRLRAYGIGKRVKAQVSQHKRILFVLPDEGEFATELVRTLNKILSDDKALFITDVGFDFDRHLKTKINERHSEQKGYVLMCEGQRNARTWVPFVMNTSPETAIAINFSYLPDTDEDL